MFNLWIGESGLGFAQWESELLSRCHGADFGNVLRLCLSRYGNNHNRLMDEQLKVTAKGVLYISNCDDAASIDQDLSRCIEVASAAGGTIKASFVLSRKGPHVVSADLWNRATLLWEPILASPWRVVVLPAALSPEMSSARGEGASAFIAGDVTIFLLISRDQFGNTLSSGGANVSARCVDALDTCSLGSMLAFSERN